MDAPHISEIVENYATAAALILAGFWALWKWWLEEMRRRRREIPSVDGKLSAVTTDLNETKALVTLDAAWRNPGVLPVELDVKKTCVNVYELNENLTLGRMSASDVLVPIYKSYPLSDWEEYILESSTDSTLQEHFVFDKGKAYFIRWEIYQHLTNPSSFAYSWVRDLVWQYPRREITHANQRLSSNSLNPTAKVLLIRRRLIRWL
jgi:hypothetical protein